MSSVGVCAELTHYSVLDGLPQNSVAAIARDRFGYLWLGTEDGLSRFDGSQFRNFNRRSPGNTALSGDYIRIMQAGNDGLWIGFESGGLTRFDFRTERFERLELNLPEAVYPRGIWQEPMSLGRNGLWVATRSQGVLRIDAQAPWTVQLRCELKNGCLASAFVNQIRPDIAGSGLWVMTANGLFWLPIQPNGKAKAQLQPVASALGLSAEPEVSDTLIDPQGGQWLSLPALGKLVKRDSTRSPWHEITAAQKPNSMEQLALGPDGHVYVTSNIGILRVDAVCNCLKPALESPPGRPQLPASLFFSLYSDGRFLWAGSWNRGLFRLDPLAPKVELAVPSVLKGEYPKTGPTAALASSENEEFTPRSLMVDSQDRLWIASMGQGLRRAEASAQPLHQRTFEVMDQVIPPLAKAGNIWSMLEQPQGTFWLASDFGLLKYQESKAVGPELVRPGSRIAAITPFARIIAAQQDGQLLIGTAYGLFRFNPQTEALAHFGPEQGLADERVYALALPTAGNPRTLIGTWSGVYALDSDAQIRRFPLTCDGRAFDPGLIWDMRRDRQGRLWLGTSVGLLRLLDSQTGAVELIDQRQGLSNNVNFA